MPTKKVPTKRDRRKSANLILRELMLEKLNSPRMHKYLEKCEPGCTKFFDSLDEDEKLELIRQVDKPIGEAVYDFFYSVNNWSSIADGYMYGMAGLRRRLKEVMAAKEDVKDTDELYEEYKREEKGLVETIEYVDKRRGK